MAMIGLGLGLIARYRLDLRFWWLIPLVLAGLTILGWLWRRDRMWTNDAFNRRILPPGVLGLIAVGLAIVIYPKDDSRFVPAALAVGGACALTVVLGLLLRRGARTRGVKGGAAG
jgi:hypothetical protein